MHGGMESELPKCGRGGGACHSHSPCQREGRPGVCVGGRAGTVWERVRLSQTVCRERITE